jgi:hypothetical protein
MKYMPLVLAMGCVQPFDGTHIEMLLHGGVQIPGDADPGNGRPPSDTHYEMYVARDQSTFLVGMFEIHPVIDPTDRCFIEDETARFPGLHSTQIEAKTLAVAMEDGTVSDAEAGLIADAQARVANQPKLAAVLKAVTGHEGGLLDKTIADFQQTVPPPDQIDDATNKMRLSLCRAFMAQHPGYYVGTDKVITIPLNGTYYGIVEGMDPRNAAFVGGGEISVNANIDAFDAMRVNWAFNDPADSRAAALSPSSEGWYYMAGVPVERTRGVINVSMRNVDYPAISGDVALWRDTGSDNVHF